MSHSYRKDRYVYGRAETKEKFYRLAIGLVLFTLCIGIIGYLWTDGQKAKTQLEKKDTLIMEFEQELDILRTLNPYHVESNEILASAVQNMDLYPGWIARVYPVPENKNSVNFMNDLGSFVMNETRFSLSSHKRYGIPQPNKSMYRLNGIFPSYKKGRLQVGVEFYLANRSRIDRSDSMSQICSCYARIDINQKRVIDKKLHMVTSFEHEQVLTGEVELAKGIYPISALVYCDEKSDFNGDEVQVSISFRNPGQYNLTTDRNAIFHIYKPENFTAKL